MEINPSQFGGHNFRELLSEMLQGRAVEADFGLIFKPVEQCIFLKFQTDETGQRSPSDIASFNLNEEGLKKTIINGFEVLRDYDAIDGFQVENEYMETFEYASFEVLNLELALQGLVDARKQEPDSDWYINIIGKGDVEDPSLVVGVAEFDIDKAPV